MSLRFHPEAAVELAAHVAWYDAHEPGLGTDFELAVYDALANVVAAGVVRVGGAGRRALLPDGPVPVPAAL